MTAIEILYLDLFTGEYVLNKEINAPPERYLTVRKGDKTYSDIWVNAKGETHPISYTQEQYENDECISIIKEAIQKHKLKRRINWVIPTNQFDKLIESLTSW